MNKNLIIALVIGAAAILTFFVLSSPAAADTPKPPVVGPTPGTPGATDVPFSPLLTGNTPNAGLGADKTGTDFIVGARRELPSVGWVKAFVTSSDVSSIKFFQIESTGETVYPGTEKFSVLQAAITQAGKIYFGRN